jgi:hypothetical protein
METTINEDNTQNITIPSALCVKEEYKIDRLLIVGSKC